MSPCRSTDVEVSAVSNDHRMVGLLPNQGTPLPAETTGINFRQLDPEDSRCQTPTSVRRRVLRASPVAACSL
jgi:hypothetical protein